ncbi:MAG: PaaI family thioesterase [Thermodesulfovibrionales bacterium]|nr:PaaI family thioesterase [Thermodesulfovibrionales bacterium]
MENSNKIKEVVLDRIRRIVENDKIFSLFSMELINAHEGYALLSAEVKEDFLNAHKIAHGAMIFAILDVAFAIAVNSITDAVGIQWSFNMFRSASLGDKIIAEAKTIHRGKNLLVVDFTAKSLKTQRLLAQGMATAMPLPIDRKATQ